MGKDNLSNEESILFRMFLHRDAKLQKLGYPRSREDPYHVHKTLGILSLCSFVYRYGYVYPTTGTLGFDGSRFDWGSMAVHTLLAFSSIIFKVPEHRLDDKPMVIYEEYRQHAMVFTARCMSVFALHTLFGQGAPEGSILPAAIIPFVVKAHHVVADMITKKWGNGSTAVRANTDKLEGRKNSDFYKQVAKLYSLYQFLAIASHILPNPRLGDLAFNAIIAIASSAFLMTLYRKRIIRGMTHLVGYSFCLILSAFHIVRLIGFYATAVTVVAFLVRTNLPREYSNKYYIWFCFLVFMQYENMPIIRYSVSTLKDTALNLMY